MEVRPENPWKVSPSVATVLTNTSNAMGSRAANIGLLADQARKVLRGLTSQITQKGDEVLQHEYVSVQQLFGAWMNAAEQLRLLLTDDDWRRDTHYLRHSINPLMGTMQQRIGAMSLQLQTEMQKLLDNAQSNSATLASAISWAAAGVLLMFLLG